MKAKQNIEICDDCNKTLPCIDSKTKTCSKCGDVVMGEAKFCLHCKDIKRSFNKAASVFVYDGKIRKLIINFKFYNKPFYKNTFAYLLYEKFKTLNFDVDVVTFVPSTKAKKKKRGYNQAEILCERFCEISKLEFVDALDKVKETSSQIGLTYKQRQENLESSFKIKDKDLVKGKNVLLIDDVFTTGATADACCSVLRKAKCKNIYVLTLAHTPINLTSIKGKETK